MGLGTYRHASCEAMNELFMNEIKFQIKILEATKYLPKFMLAMNVTEIANMADISFRSHFSQVHPHSE